MDLFRDLGVCAFHSFVCLCWLFVDSCLSLFLWLLVCVYVCPLGFLLPFGTILRISNTLETVPCLSCIWGERGTPLQHLRLHFDTPDENLTCF